MALKTLAKKIHKYWQVKQQGTNPKNLPEVFSFYTIIPVNPCK